MKKNNIQFAVVREDPDLLISFLKKNQVKKTLIICSGGCSALTYKACMSELEIDLIDINKNQIDLAKEKVKEVINENYDQLRKLNSSGNFESLFRQLSSFIFEFVIEKSELESYFLGTKKLDLNEIFSNPYWNVAFELFFSDIILNTMFGADATQHSPKGSYPGYFQSKIEEAMRKVNYKENYFLHHFFLDEYLENCQPTYYKLKMSEDDFNYINGEIDDSIDIKDYDFIDLSNILDWMNDLKIQSLLRKVCSMKPGAFLIFRQLNNSKCYQQSLLPDFSFMSDMSEKFLQESRSMFYEKINVYRRN